MIRIAAILWGVIFAVTALSFAASAHADTWSVSATNIDLRKNERIVGYKIRLKSASVRAIDKVTLVWSITINNFLNDEPPWNSTVDAAAGVGAAAVDASYFRHFLEIEEYKGEFATNIPLDVELTIRATTDFENTRDVVIPMASLAREKISSAKGADH